MLGEPSAVGIFLITCRLIITPTLKGILGGTHNDFLTWDVPNAIEEPPYFSIWGVVMS